MQYRTVTSNEEPSATQYLQGKLLINIDIEETTSTDNDGNETTLYTFTQIVTDKSSDYDEEIATYRAEIGQEYLDSTDWINSKYIEYVTINATLTGAEFAEKYADVYTAREEARAYINALG